jgi:hypothetical protein
MPESIDWPPTHTPTHPPRRRRRLLLILVTLAVIFFGGRTALSSYMDVLWFGSLGYRDVFWKTLSLQWGIFTAFSATTFFILYGSFLALKRAHLADLPSGHTILIGGQPVKLPVERVLRLIALGVSLAIAVATGAAMTPLNIFECQTNSSNIQSTIRRLQSSNTQIRTALQSSEHMLMRVRAVSRQNIDLRFGNC